jgi:hypothetical protein
MRPNSLKVPAGAFVAAVLTIAPAAIAQISEVTAEDVQSVPEAFRPAARTSPNFAGFAPHGTPSGYKPNPDPRDFSGSYVSAPDGGGPPGGSAGPRGGGPPGAGPPAGAQPQGVTAGAARATCLPTFGGGAYPTHIVSSPTRLLVVGEENHHVRRIRVGEPARVQVAASFSGASSAHWDGNSLVAESTGIIGRSGTLRERWTKLPDGSLQVTSVTVGGDGQSAGAERSSRYTWRPDLQFLENICEDFGEAFTQGYGQK